MVREGNLITEGDSKCLCAMKVVPPKRSRISGAPVFFLSLFMLGFDE